MKTTAKFHLTGFALLEISYWCFSASFISFLTSYLLHKGLTNTALSILLAFYLLAAFLGSFVWGFVCDHLLSNRTVILLCLLVSGILMYLIYFSAPSLPALALFYPLIGFFAQPQAAAIDAWLLTACHHDISVYGKIRCTPSVFYAFAAFFLGRCISAKGYFCMLIFGTFFLSAGILTAFFLPVPASPAETNSSSAHSASHPVSLCKNKPYLFLILFLLFVGLATSPLFNLKASILSGVGGTVTDLGIDSFIAASTQVPFLLFAEKIKRRSLQSRYTRISSFYLLTLLFAFFAISPAMIFAGTFFYNAAYGIMLPAMREVVEKNVVSEERNLAHSVADAVFNSFSGILSLLYSGILLDLCGAKTLLFLCILISLIPLFMAVFLFPKSRC